MYSLGNGTSGIHADWVAQSSKINAAGAGLGKLLVNSRMQEYLGGLYGSLIGVFRALQARYNLPAIVFAQYNDSFLVHLYSSRLDHVLLAMFFLS